MSTTSKAIVSMITFVTVWEIGVSFHTGITFISNNICFASSFSIDVTIIINRTILITSTWFWIRKVKESWFGGITVVTNNMFLARTFSVNWIAIVAFRAIWITLTFLAIFSKMFSSTLVTSWKFNKSSITLITLVSNNVSITKAFSIFIASVIFRSLSIA